MLVRPAPQPIPSAAWQAARQSLAQLPRFLQQNAQALARLPGFLLQGVKSLPLALKLKPSRARAREASLRALLRSNASATFVRVLAYVAALAVLALAAAHWVRSTPAAIVDAEPAPTVEWVQVAKPFPAFSLPIAELADASPDYAMWRHVSGGRQDIMTWGELQGAGPHLRVEIYRPAAEIAHFDSAEREIAARLEGTDASAFKPVGAMETKFGAMSLVAFSINPARQCLGFVRAYKNPQLQILGWHCTSGAVPVEHDLAACALDRLTLLAAGGEPKVRELFARAELKRTFCGQRSHLLTPTPRLAHDSAKWKPR
jgi:hypothetical protein